MPDNPKDPRIVLLLNVSDPMGGLLKRKLAQAGIQVLSFDTLAIFDGDLHIPLDLRGSAKGWIRPRGFPRILELHHVCGTICENDAAGAADEFSACEQASVLHMVRMACRNPLNCGRAWSSHAYALSLPEQWALCARGGISHPQWEANEGGLIDPDRVAVSQIYDRSVRRMSDATLVSDVRLLVDAPRGAVIRCAFAGEILQLSRRHGERIVDVNLPPAAMRAVRDLSQSVRSAFDLDYGELVFSYLGRPVFWSVVPFLSREVLELPSAAPLIGALAGLVIR